ncbi:MAG TPA: helix-turn-helix transcriptional regulator [Solirubrobacteraceae bacterium]|nr:helix-turn-helix transcriptional regulator [Solirubrobacteraceae bacterium]
MNVAERFSRNLLRARESAGLSQEEIAFRAALHRTEIGLLERGVRVPRIDTLAKLAGSLGLEPAVLLDGIAWDPGEFHPGGFVEKGSEG